MLALMGKPFFVNKKIILGGMEKLCQINHFDLMNLLGE